MQNISLAIINSLNLVKAAQAVLCSSPLMQNHGCRYGLANMPYTRPCTWPSGFAFRGATALTSDGSNTHQSRRTGGRSVPVCL